MFYCYPFFLAVNLEMRRGSVWVLANINITGYYRVNYDHGNWESLFAQLNSEHQVHSQAALTCFRFYYLIDVELCLYFISCLTYKICCAGYPSDKQSPACG